jgi:hypothetical protein
VTGVPDIDCIESGGILYGYYLDDVVWMEIIV